MGSLGLELSRPGSSKGEVDSAFGSRHPTYQLARDSLYDIGNGPYARGAASQKSRQGRLFATYDPWPISRRLQFAAMI